MTTSPIKGTTKRSEDPDGSVLRSSAKDAAENIMITDLMRNDLSRVCVPGSVAVTGCWRSSLIRGSGTWSRR